jgi:3-hydroxyacyl-[acyl-carrier-protein] dehydratase
MPPPALVDPTAIDATRVLVDLEGLRRINPQRFEMEQLTAIVLIDKENHVIVGYKDVGHDEFWARGHMPGYPLMPGVLMCEAAAQLAGYYSTIMGFIRGGFMGFGGLEDVRFRGQVRPGDRLILVAKAHRLHHRQSTFDCQGFVGTDMVFQARVIGLPIVRKDPAQTV